MVYPGLAKRLGPGAALTAPGPLRYFGADAESVPSAACLSFMLLRAQIALILIEGHSHRFRDILAGHRLLAGEHRDHDLDLRLAFRLRLRGGFAGLGGFAALARLCGLRRLRLASQASAAFAGLAASAAFAGFGSP